MQITERFNNSSIKAKMIFSVLTIAALCILVTLTTSYNSSKDALTQMANDQLISMRSISKKRVTDFLNRSQIFTKLLSTERLTEGLMLSYESAFFAAGYTIGKDQKLEASSYKQLDATYGASTEELIKSYTLANFLLVNMNGQVVYSAKPSDYGYFAGRNLQSGELQSSKLASCVKDAKESKSKNVFYSDYEFVPQFGRTMSFFCVNLFAEFPHLSEGINKGDFLGVIVGELDLNYLNGLLSARDGMGQTGQTYLMGSDGLLRSDFYTNKEKFNINNSHKIKVKVNNPIFDKALTEKGEKIMTLTDPNGKEVLSAITTFDFQGKTWALISEKEIDEIYSPISALLKKVFFYSLITLFIVCFVVIYLSKKLLAPIIEASEILGSVCDSLNTDSNALLESSSTLNDSSKEQSIDLQTTVQAVQEISSTIEQNTSNAKNSEELAKLSLATAENGRIVMIQMMQSMKDINQGNQDILTQVEDSNKQINEILVMISEIGTKTKLINDIVFQTKLLSFNASVEAARAGENGKGFAVVAEEVGNLAQSSGNSAKEISELLAESISKVESIIHDTTSKIENVSLLGRERVNTGQETAQKCSMVFDEIVKSFNQVSVLVSEISLASGEQNEAMTGINQAMARLNAGTDKSTQIASESSQAATQLESRAKTLREVVQNIQQVIHGA